MSNAFVALALGGIALLLLAFSALRATPARRRVDGSVTQSGDGAGVADSSADCGDGSAGDGGGGCDGGGD